MLAGIPKISSMNGHITVALVEDNAVNRHTFLQNIAYFKDIVVSFTVSNGQECLEELKGLQPPRLPQVIFVDIEMPALNGIDTIRIGKQLYPYIHFVVLTIFEDEDKIFEAIQGGASGYILKHESHFSLKDAITEILEYGGAPMSPAIARKTLQMLSTSVMQPPSAEQHPIPETITAREKEILQYTVSGWDAKRIASVVGISVLTVRKHIANIYQKLHVQSRAQIIQLAHRNKWFRL